MDLEKEPLGKPSDENPSYMEKGVDYNLDDTGTPPKSIFVL